MIKGHPPNKTTLLRVFMEKFSNRSTHRDEGVSQMAPNSFQFVFVNNLDNIYHLAEVLIPKPYQILSQTQKLNKMILDHLKYD